VVLGDDTASFSEDPDPVEHGHPIHENIMSQTKIRARRPGVKTGHNLGIP